MLYHVEGTVTDIDVNLVVIDCHGIGFALNVTSNTLAGLHLGERAKLYVSESIGESNYDLFGFLDKSERRFFEMLISVSRKRRLSSSSRVSTRASWMVLPENSRNLRSASRLDTPRWLMTSAVEMPRVAFFPM